MPRLPVIAYRLIGWYSTTRFNRRLHPWLYGRAGGQGILGRSLGAETVLVQVPGRRSGAPRPVALYAFPVGTEVGSPDGSLVVVASRGGSGRIPDWYLNLMEAARVDVQARGRRFVVRPRELSGDAYEIAFERAAAGYPGYRLYRRKATYHIPIVALEPVRAAATPDSKPAQ
ncbi:MAG TPA: nitroreductase family deazaflavin-dependent oxidoreductase [Candidatus Polarisedimenticolia bacterium]|nr:nitroreductase family deazaflavin-dependent oxidoreductase [Candidatus Polarisedimenticolia bacterium]